VRTADLALLFALAIVPALLGPLTDAPSGKRRAWRPGIQATLLGALGFVVAKLGLYGVATYLGVELPREGHTDVVSVAFAFLVAGPIEESLRVVAAVPSLRSKNLRRPYDAMRISIASSLGFQALQTIDHLHDAPITWLLVVRTALDLAAHVALSSTWGYALGRERRRAVGGVGFTRGFMAAVMFGSIASHLLFARGPSAIFAVVPLALTTLLFSLVARRDLLKMEAKRPRGRLSRLLRVKPPSMAELEKALLTRPDRPMMLRWIAFGALVTIGVLSTLLAASVMLGRQTGVDFAAVDQADAFQRSAPPLILLGTAAFAAFPTSGFLVARASNAQGVLEPALGASIAIVAIVVLLGLAAPIAVAFGLALAPLAFALACVGAWAGLER